jgi:hypothetical protein
MAELTGITFRGACGTSPIDATRKSSFPDLIETGDTGCDGFSRGRSGLGHILNHA